MLADPGLQLDGASALPGASCQLVMLYAACQQLNWPPGPLLQLAARVAGAGAEAARADGGVQADLRMPSDGTVPKYEGLKAVPVGPGGGSSSSSAEDAQAIADLQQQVRVLQQRLQQRQAGASEGEDGGNDEPPQARAMAAYARQLDEVLDLRRQVVLQRQLKGPSPNTDEIKAAATALRQLRMELYDEAFVGLRKWFEWLYAAALNTDRVDGRVESLIDIDRVKEVAEESKSLGVGANMEWDGMKSITQNLFQILQHKSLRAFKISPGGSQNRGRGRPREPRCTQKTLKTNPEEPKSVQEAPKKRSRAPKR